MRDYLIGPIALAAIAIVIGAECAARADEWTAQEVAIARLCVNEATWSGDDCAAITEARGRYSVPELRQMHRRALAEVRTDGRRWIAGLDAAGSMPDGWPESDVPWETSGRPAWLRTLATVRRTLAGGRVCSARPSIWGGASLDAPAISRREAEGYVRVNCGTTRNVFMRRGR